MDQLRQVLNRVDIMVRWRTNEAHPGRTVTNTSDGFIDLTAGKLAAFTGLCPLGNLNLEFISIGEIPDGDPEPT